ncbi:MAG: PilW family protein [Pseudomonadales bacterium]|nr:PilW family protein [Pseudomonadales bacterium]
MLKTQYHRGYTLIEILVALALSGFLLVGVLQIFINSKDIAKLTQGFTEVQDSGRFATEITSREIRRADYWGCLRDTTAIFDHLDQSDDDWDASMLFTGESGIDGVESSAANLTFGLIKIKASTDIITLKGAVALGDLVIDKPYMTEGSARIHIKDASSIKLGQRLLITDCSGADLFTNTKNNPSTGVNHNTGTVQNSEVSDPVDNATKPMSHTYDGSAQILIPYTKTFFIGENPVGGHSLYVVEDQSAPSELAPGVMDMQILYGEDLTDNRSVDQYVAADAVTSMDKVMSIKMEFEVESANTQTSGNKLTRTYSKTTNIRNRTL